MRIAISLRLAASNFLNGLPVRLDAPASFRLIAVIRFIYIRTPDEWQ
jgi:hypothetical protein